MGARVKHIALTILLAGLLLPGLQSIFQLVPERGLHGAYEAKQLPELSKNTWLGGEFQQDFDPWLEENIGFHNSLVRLNNQLDYSLFHRTHAKGVVRGKNGNLFEYDYIRAWMGKDFVGTDLLDKRLRGFRFLQQHLKDNFDIDLVLVIEPGKASLYPEDIPEKYKKAEPGKTNYEYIRDRAGELGINFIDLNAWYMQIKDTCEYPVFPVQGTHWSEFAMWFAADSLIRYIEETRGIDLPEVVRDSVVYSRELRSTDYDEGVTLNLLFELEHGEMPYPAFHFREEEHHTRPNVLSIADSYYWNIVTARIPKNLFHDWAFWYFYKKVYPNNLPGDIYVSELNLRSEVEKRDVIFFMSTERFLFMIDRGFVEDLMQLYGKTSDLDRLNYYKTRILINNVWFTSILESAEEKGISLGEQLNIHADYMLWSNEPEVYYSIYGPEAIVREIMSSDSWYNTLKQEAEENGEDIQDRIRAEARHQLNTRYPEALKKYEWISRASQRIRMDTAWYRQVEEKAERYYLSIEEMIRIDAEWMYRMRSEVR